MVQLTLKLSVAKVFLMVALQDKNENCTTVQGLMNLKLKEIVENPNFTLLIKFAWFGSLKRA